MLSDQVQYPYLWTLAMDNVLNWCSNKVELTGHGLLSLYNMLEFNTKIVWKFEQLCILYMYTAYIPQIYTAHYEKDNLILKLPANLIKYGFHKCISHVYCTIWEKEANSKIYADLSNWEFYRIKSRSKFVRNWEISNLVCQIVPFVVKQEEGAEGGGRNKAKREATYKIYCQMVTHPSTEQA